MKRSGFSAESRRRSAEKAREKARTNPRKPLRRTGGLKRSATPAKRKPVSPASPAQRAKVRHALCIVCGSAGCHPAHLIDRSLGGGDDALDVVPACPGCHRAYDEGDLDLLPYLEPGHRAELAFAVERVGLLRALQRITNRRWEPSR